MEDLKQIVLSEAGAVGLLLLLALLYMTWRERQVSQKLEARNEKILDLSLKTLDTLNKLTETIRERMPR